MTQKDVARFWEKVNKSTPEKCWNWTATRRRNWYGQFWLNGANPGAHRVSWIIHFGAIPKGLWVLHKCDNPICVNPYHLFLGTHQDNETDKVQKGRQATGSKNGATLHPDKILRGESHYKAILQESTVLQIKQLYEIEKVKPRHIASRLGVSKSNVRNVVYGNCWSHLKLDSI